jgi:hypothetical protein
VRCYRVTLNVSNCLREAGDDTFRVNCAVLCDVDAADSGAAETAAIEVLRGCAALHGQLANAEHDSPLIEVEHVDPVDGIELHQPDLAWYAPDDD